VAEAFERLATNRKLSNANLRSIIREIPSGEGTRFARTLREIPGHILESEATGPDFLATIAGSPRRMDAVQNLGAGPLAALYQRSGGNAEKLDGFLGSLSELEKVLPPEKRAIEFQELLKGLENGETRSWIRLEDTRRAKVGRMRLTGLEEAIQESPRAQAGADRLLRGQHYSVLDELLDEHLDDNPAFLRKRLSQIGELTDEQADGLAALCEASKHGHMGGYFDVNWDDALDLTPSLRDDLLTLSGQVRGSVDYGLDLVLGEALAATEQEMEGGLGHLHAIRTMQSRYPGCRMRCEIPVVDNRVVDIEVQFGGRRIDVEVKTNKKAPTIDREQIRKDLIRHVGDRFEDLLYLYAPERSGQLSDVEDAMMRSLKHRDVKAALQSKGIYPQDAESWLRRRISEGLVDTYSF
jgi:hypothetical protein